METTIDKKVMLAECELSISKFNNNLHSVGELTLLLHRAYKLLSDNGCHFMAASQSAVKTLERLKDSIGLVAMKGNAIIGTICFYPNLYSHVEECAWYSRADVGRLGQFAVDPDFQKLGLGKLMIQTLEEIAVQYGKTHLALDTSEKTQHLIDYYEKLGFQHVGYMQWNHDEHRSVVMSKALKSEI